MSNCALVLSAPRSGSSFITNVIKESGYSTGKNETQVKDSFNEEGYFENASILRFNEKVLTSIGSSIFTSCDLTHDQESDSMKYREELIKIISYEYSDPFVIKDPRIILLRKLYNEVFKELDIPVKVVALFRKAENCAASLSRLSGRAGEETMLCVNYYHNFLKNLEDSDSIIKINLEDILNDLSGLKCLISFLGSEYKESIPLLLKTGLMHYK
jgi:hypothetical protein